MQQLHQSAEKMNNQPRGPYPNTKGIEKPL
jgi:hypothetical protein